MTGCSLLAGALINSDDSVNYIKALEIERRRGSPSRVPLPLASQL